MRKHARFILWLIVVLTIIAVVVDFPQSLTINKNFSLFGKTISINKTIKGLNTNFQLGPFYVHKDLSFKEGLDLQGGVSVTLQANMKGVPPSQRDSALDAAQLVIERRVNLYGVSEPVVQTSKVNGDYRIIAELPGVKDVNQAVQLIGQTAQLTFWEEGASGSAQASSSALPSSIGAILTNPVKTSLTGKDITDATVTFDPKTGAPDVEVTMDSTGADKFAKITEQNIGKPIVIVLDNQIVSYPVVQSAIINGDTLISGNFTTEQATLLAQELKAGALPVPLKVLQQQQISATLGQSSLTKSLFAGILGFLIIVIFMILLYGRLGLIASIALIIYTLIVLAIFKLIPVTLTLAGIAGFILSIGMAVDANILIFERMREEIRAGKQRTTAIELGFSRAWTSIRDSNISSLITSAILYKFGTGIVRGFALTLAIGVLVSMFSAIVVTRTFLRLLYRI